MTKVFISYGSEGYLQSLKRIAKEAKQLGIFDKIITYQPKDMPEYIKASPLKAYQRGNGYWIWKPYIIWHTMMEYPNSIVVYADAGCTLQDNMEEWMSWFDIMERYDTIAFQYRHEYQYPWESFGHCSTTNLEWNKESLIKYFDPLMKNRDWLEKKQVWGGVIIAGRSSKAIKMWLDISLLRPDLIYDVFGNESDGQSSAFKEHRHDQSVWSAVSMYLSQSGHIIKILPETAESDPKAAIVATRKCNSVKQIPPKTRIISSAVRIMGQSRYQQIHQKISSCILFRKLVIHFEHKHIK